MKYISKGNHRWMLLATLLLFGLSISHAKIVFDSKRNGDTLYHVYVMEDNGSNVRRVTSPDFYDGYPRWFPDGKRILFSRAWAQGNGQRNNEFYIIDANGMNERNFMKNHPTDFYPRLSPDGKQVAFASMRAGTYDIYTYYLESGELRQLTNNIKFEGFSYRMDWSPDGRKVAYQHDTAAEGDNIWIMNADGSGKRRLSPPDQGDVTLLKRGGPSWSPSGRHIMYYESEGVIDKGEIKKIAERLIVQNAHTGVREVHKFGAKDSITDVCWMGDDQTVLLSIEKNFNAPTANYEIYRYDLVSRQLINLTNNPGHDFAPHWILGGLGVFPAGKLTTLWGKLKKID